MSLGVRDQRGRRVLALDVGDRRIGVAVGDESGTIASPIGRVLRARSGDASALAEIVRLAAEWQVDRIVVGLPTGLSGREGPQAASVRAFAATLAAALDPDPDRDPDQAAAVRLVFWDERLTTTIAERTLLAAGAKRAQRRERIDAVAAAVILQDFLDAERRHRPPTPAPNRT